MESFTILIEPDERLRRLSLPVSSITEEVHSILDRMVYTMRKAPGIGLAAPQVNILQRMIVMEAGPSGLMKMINPELVTKSSDETAFLEGCLSIRDYRAYVKRPKQVHVKFLTPEGEKKEQLFCDLEAICVQHEMDHLDGILFIDYLSRLKQSIVRKKLSRSAYSQ